MIYSIDASMNSSAIVKWSNDWELLDVFYFTNRKKDIKYVYKSSINYFNNKKLWKGAPLKKNLFMIDAIIDYLLKDTERPISITIEGNSFNSIGKTSDIFQYTGALKYALMKEFPEVELCEYPPTQIKKFAGGGRYDKVMMRKAMDLHYPLLDLTLELNDLDLYFGRHNHPQEDIVDAFWLGQLHKNILGQ